MAALSTQASEGTATLVLRGSRQLRRRTRQFNVYAFAGIVSILASIATRRPELLAIGAPFLVALAAAFTVYTAPDVRAGLRFASSRVVEGEDAVITVEIASDTGLPRVEIELQLSERLEAAGSTRAITSVAPAGASSVDFVVTAAEWGVASVERIAIRTVDRFGLFGGRMEFHTNETIRISLPDDRGQAALEADRFRRIVGSHPSNDRGQGLEIADIRPYQQGDSMKSINWRISNRRNEPWVTLRHPDRSTTLVLIVDAHDGEDNVGRDTRGGDAGDSGSAESDTQRRSVAAAMALARAHLAMHDQVGLLIVGHKLGWIPPKLGRNQLHSIGDALVAVGNAPQASLRLYRPPAVASIPTDAIVVAISPLLDPLMTALVAEMRSHGNPVSLLLPESVPAPPPLLGRPGRYAQECRRLATIEHAVGVRSLRERGVAIVPWAEGEPVAVVIQALHRLRQSMARARSW